MNLERPGIALIGCGQIAANCHLPGIQASPFALRAVCDAERERVERFKREQNLDASVAVCTSLDEILKLDGVQAVSIATPPASHAPLSIRALDAGKHVLCEKPSTLSASENRAVCAAVARNPGLTIQFFSSRFRDGAAPAARRFVREGRLGVPYKADIQFWLPAARTCDRGGPPWFGQKAHAGGGPFMDMGQYFLDRLFFILGWPRWRRLSAQTFSGFPTGNPPGVVYDVEDHMSLLAHFDGGLALTLETTARVNQHYRWSTTVAGSAGTLILDNAAPRRAVFRALKDGVPVEEDLEAPESAPDMQARLERLALRLKGERPELGTDHEQALYITEFCEAAYRSAAEGRELRAPEEAA
ncbi:MAG: Gfo/Idh/MocA family oxidoreductase [Planctomycetota bacterium]|nr:Gfo/Idh/MocA family oxidoreductase [Planctomycetota bacterium]